MTSASSKEKFIIVGLGNPGRTYRKNRHNIGFMVVDQLAARNGIRLGRVQQKAVIGDGYINSIPVLLAKPQTYMNRSGDPVRSLVSYYRLPLSNLMVIYDEIDLPFGVLRLRENGGSGGHNGMKSIISNLGTEFPRMRLGVGRPPGKMEPAAFLLRDFGKSELTPVQEMIERAAEAVELFLSNGLELAMNRFNGEVSGLSGE